MNEEFHDFSRQTVNENVTAPKRIKICEPSPIQTSDDTSDYTLPDMVTTCLGRNRANMIQQKVVWTEHISFKPVHREVDSCLATAAPMIQNGWVKCLSWTATPSCLASLCLQVSTVDVKHFCRKNYSTRIFVKLPLIEKIKTKPIWLVGWYWQNYAKLHCHYYATVCGHFVVQNPNLTVDGRNSALADK